jgi:hypothetical protein
MSLKVRPQGEKVVNTIAPLLLSILLAIDQRGGAGRTPLESMARDLLTSFNAGRFEAASKDFNETMRATATPSILAELKRRSDAELGGFRFITDVRQRSEGGFRIVELVCKYEKSSASFRVVFDIDNSIGAIFLDPIAIAPVDPALEVTARALLKNFVAGDFEATAKQFDPKLRVQLPPPRLAQLQAQVTKTYGTFRSVTAINQVTEQDYRTIELTAAYDRLPVLFLVVFDSAGHVTGVKIGPAAPR